MVKRHEKPAEDRTENKRARLGSESAQAPHEVAAPESSETNRYSLESSNTLSSDPSKMTYTHSISTAAGKEARKPFTTTSDIVAVAGGAPAPTTNATTNASPTVQSIIPLPTAILFDHIQTAPYQAALRSRLEQLSKYTNESANVYALGKLPPTATWGTYQPGNDHRKELCDPAKNQAISIWTLGHIVSSWFAKDGQAVKQAAITIVPLSAELGKQTARLLNGFCIPNNVTVPNEYGLNFIRATTWQSAPNDNNPTLFGNVFDATEALRSKEAMDEYDVLNLRKDDLVLTECKLTRYHTRDGESNVWMQRAQMELTAISLLHKGVDRAPTKEDGPHEIVDLCI